MGRPKQAEIKTTFPVRLSDDRRAALKEEADTREAIGIRSGVSEVIRIHLDRYREISWRDLPALRDGEWCALFEALGAPPVEIQAIEWLGATVARAAEEGALARKWKVDAGELAAKARAWSFGQACAVADAAVRFRSLVEDSGDATEAARQATTRPAGLVLEPPAPARQSKPKRSKARG